MNDVPPVGRVLLDPAMSSRQWAIGLLIVVLVFLHNTLPYLTMMPRVNVDEPWLIERAYEVMRTGVPSQPMLGLHQAYLLQVGYGYLLAPWMAVAGVGLYQARLFGVLLGLGIILMAAAIGRRTIDPATGLMAALFLAVDTNFLGGVRNARTDIPSVFFVTAALAAYLVARQRSRPLWFVVSGASVGLAMLCHGNAFWVGAILLVWYLLDYGRRAFVAPFGYFMLGGFLLAFGPYLVVVLTRWSDVQVQIGNFAGDRVPDWRPSFVLQQMGREIERYRYWYFGLVTNLVPNPLLWVFQGATIAGAVALAARAIRAGRRPLADPRGPTRLLILVAGSVFIFAGFINNKVPVYLPHLLVGFSLAAGFAVSEAAYVAGRLVRSARPQRRLDRLIPGAVLLFVFAFGAAGVAYYEKWYSSVRKSELVPYESTAATLRTLVPDGPKYIFASPQFWTPFHAQPQTTFYSYAAAQPVEIGATPTLPGVSDGRPIYLIVDEAQWLPELTARVSGPTVAWQEAWIHFIERRCTLDAVAPGTAHGTLAVYRCALGGAAHASAEPPRIVGGATEYVPRERVLAQTAEDLFRWKRYEDPRRTAASKPEVGVAGDGLRISGTGWPGIVMMFDADDAEKYLIRVNTRRTRDGDLLYLGTWQRLQVRSLAGGSSSGIPVPLGVPPWFPGDRAFVATAPQVQVLVYSEAPETDFVISSLDVFRLVPRTTASPAR